MPIKETPMWLGKQILDPDDSASLEAEAAIKEFSGKLPRHEAEQQAHADYVKSKRLDAAAHHLAGVKAANAGGDPEQAAKHAALYGEHMKALGHDPHGAVPAEVLSRSGQLQEPLYRFKAHKADMYALPKEALPKEEGMQKSEAETCDYDAKTTGERCRNPRSRKVAGRYLCHHHADLAAKDDKRDEGLEKSLASIYVKAKLLEKLDT